ncbi:MAG: hypothetical protein DCC66_11030 [Planctomycetota bacterium]|nr:MAG: hypothetical protein DCC66_11030 [Planctomycetota bacterium]
MVQAQSADDGSVRRATGDDSSDHTHLQYIEPQDPITFDDETGRPVEYTTERRWRYICGSSVDGKTVEDLARIAEESKRLFEQGPVLQVSQGALRGPGGLNIVFNVSGSPPAGAVEALEAVAVYIESQFSDPITVTINIGFQAMGGGVLGATSSDYVNNISYSTIRSNLQTLDFDDTIQTFLPPAPTCPVRYDANSDTVTNQASMDITEANWAAMRNITTAGTNGSTTFNTNFTFDYDPSNGVGGLTCFRSVAVHEVGHAMGFVSATDFNPGDMEGLDLFRFQLTDGAFDYNPDTTAEFTSRPRLVHNNNPNDSHIFDNIQAEYRMEDGSPNQASHFRDNFNIGIMDPTLGGGETFFPNYFRTADLRAFDAIGWDYPPQDPGDVDPPTPNPMSFSINPNPVDHQSIAMQATEATDNESPPAFYNFDYVSGAGGHDSGWQPSRDYTDVALPQANSAYTYRVAARDSSPNINQTSYSANIGTGSGIQTPTGISFGTITDTTIQVTATGTFTNIGFLQTGFFFEMTPPAGTGANVWVTGAGANTITVTGLTPCTQYSFRVKARNFEAFETPFNSISGTVTLTTGCAECSLLGDLNLNGLVEGGDIAGFVGAKLGSPVGGTNPMCAEYGGTLEQDIDAFVADLLGL